MSKARVKVTVVENRLPEVAAQWEREAKAAIGVYSELMAEEMKRNVTAKGLILTGKLLDDIKVRRVEEDGTVGVIGTERFYGMFAEYGTKRQPATPWARPAYDRVRPLFLAHLRKVMRES